MVHVARKPYLVAVEDLKVVRPEDAADLLDPEEFVYLLGPEVECVVFSDVGICPKPQLDKAA